YRRRPSAGQGPPGTAMSRRASAGSSCGRRSYGSGHRGGTPLYDRAMPAARKSFSLAALLALAAPSLAGCSHPTRVAQARTLDVALSEYRVNPSAASAPSGILELIVRNYGRLSHNLVISSEGHADGSTPAIPPGSEATLLVDLPPGQYTMSSSILNDAALGVRGTLTVTYR